MEPVIHSLMNQIFYNILNVFTVTFDQFKKCIIWFLLISSTRSIKNSVYVCISKAYDVYLHLHLHLCI